MYQLYCRFQIYKYVALIQNKFQYKLKNHFTTVAQKKPIFITNKEIMNFGIYFKIIMYVSIMYQHKR